MTPAAREPAESSPSCHASTAVQHVCDPHGEVNVRIQHDSFLTRFLAGQSGLHRSAQEGVQARRRRHTDAYIIVVRSGHIALTVTAFLMIPFYIFFPAAISRTFRQAFRRVQESQADILAGLQESVTSTREIVAFGREEWDEKRLSTLFTRALRQRLRAILLEARYGGLQNLASFVSPFFILIVGAPFVLRGDMTIGSLLAFQQWTQLLYTHARSLYHTNQSVQQALGAAERVHQFFSEPVDSVRLLGSRRLERVEGALELQDVGFSYDGTRRVLKDVNLAIEPGMRVALVGPSGAGKSTLMLLLMRFFDPDRGRITLDGVDLRELDVRWLRDQIGVVFQDPLLSARNLYENIAFGRDGVTREAVLRATDLAQVTAFASELPGGFDTPIGERGVRLSGGQKQRVALARALVRDPKILLLDEATSARDPESEHLVQEAMEAVMEGRTTVVIAHRLSTIRGADLIVFLRDGQVVEAGIHAELLARGGEYARFHPMQFGDAEGA